MFGDYCKDIDCNMVTYIVFNSDFKFLVHQCAKAPLSMVSEDSYHAYEIDIGKWIYNYFVGLVGILIIQTKQVGFVSNFY